MTGKSGRDKMPLKLSHRRRFSVFASAKIRRIVPTGGRIRRMLQDAEIRFSRLNQFLRTNFGLRAACGCLNKQGREQGQRKTVQKIRIHIWQGDGCAVEGRDKGRHNDQKQTYRCQTQRETAVKRENQRGKGQNTERDELGNEIDPNKIPKPQDDQYVPDRQQQRKNKLIPRGAPLKHEKPDQKGLGNGRKQQPEIIERKQQGGESKQKGRAKKGDGIGPPKGTAPERSTVSRTI